MSESPSGRGLYVRKGCGTWEEGGGNAWPIYANGFLDLDPPQYKDIDVANAVEVRSPTEAGVPERFQISGPQNAGDPKNGALNGGYATQALTSIAVALPAALLALLSFLSIHHLGSFASPRPERSQLFGDEPSNVSSISPRIPVYLFYSAFSFSVSAMLIASSHLFFLLSYSRRKRGGESHCVPSTSFLLFFLSVLLFFAGEVKAGEEQGQFDDVFEEIFTEVEDRYGEIEEMNICDNIGEHMVGNVYIKFRREKDAERAEKELNERWFGGEAIYAELSPVTDFREACCRQYEMGECMRGGFCNFMHLKPISYELRRELYNRFKPWPRRKRRRKKLRKSKKDKKQRKQSRPRDITPTNSSLTSHNQSSSPESSTNSSDPIIPKAYQIPANHDSTSEEESEKERPTSPSLPAAFRSESDKQRRA